MGTLVICTHDEFLSYPSKKDNAAHFLLIDEPTTPLNDMGCKFDILPAGQPCVRPFIQPHQNVLDWLLAQPAFSRIILTQHNAIGYLVLCMLLVSDTFDECEVELLSNKSAVTFKHRHGRQIREGLSLRYMQRQISSLLTQIRTARTAERDTSKSSVTIIMTHYNRPQYVRQALQSIAVQTHKPAQVVVVDDNSEHESFAALTKHLNDILQPAGIPFQLHRNKGNIGPSLSRNSAMKSATSEFVLFLDDDDVLVPEALQSLLLAQSRSNADFVSFAYRYFASEDYPSKDTSAKIIHFQGPGDIQSAITYNCVGGISVLYRTSLLKQLRFLGSSFTGEEDWRFILSALIKGGQGTYCPTPLLWYRNLPSSLSKRMDKPVSRSGITAELQSLFPDALCDLPDYINHLQDDVNQASLRDISEFLFFLGKQFDVLSSNPIMIYGAGEYGKKIGEALCANGLDTNLKCFIDRNAKKSDVILDKPVVPPEQAKGSENTVVIVATFSVITPDNLDLSFNALTYYMLSTFCQSLT